MSALPKNNFNLLRLLFASLVLVSHSPEMIDGDRHRELLTMAFGTMSFGEFAVAGFFLVSGYLILKSWLRNPSTKDFLNKRIRRIFPAFVVASVLSVAIVGPLGAESASIYFAQFDVPVFFRDLLLLRVPTTPSVFADSFYPAVNGSMWTISIEFSCYLGVMVLGVLGLTKRWAWVMLTAILLFAFMLYRLGYPPYLAKTLHFNLAGYFGVGGCFLLWRDKIRFTAKGAIVAIIAAVLGLMHPLAVNPVFAIAGGYLIFWFAFADIPSIAKFNTLPDVSYGLYLYGWPIQKLLVWWFPTISPAVLFFSSLIVAAAFGAASWYGIEKRFMMRRPLPISDSGLRTSV